MSPAANRKIQYFESKSHMLIQRLLIGRAIRGMATSQPVKKMKTTCSFANPQDITGELTPSAIFITALIKSNPEKVRDLIGEVPSLANSIGFRAPASNLSCVTGIGVDGWKQMFPEAKVPKYLHPFEELKGKYTAPSTPGDLLFHIRGTRMDTCFELARVILDKLSGNVEVVDETHGFGYFDQRDLLGFVDGTENPKGDDAVEATVSNASDDSDYVGGSYVITQKYLHDLKKWNQVPVEEQEKIIGREKLSDIELDDEKKYPFAHNVLTNLDSGEEILRDNMPFGNAGKGEYGTYFIGYAKTPLPTEEMMRNMFLGNPEGNYDRVLDYSEAITGNLFFVPSADFIGSLSDD